MKNIVTEALETYKQAKRAKHDADMAFKQAESALVSALKDNGVRVEDLVDGREQLYGAGQR